MPLAKMQMPMIDNVHHLQDAGTQRAAMPEAAEARGTTQKQRRKSTATPQLRQDRCKLTTEETVPAQE